MRSSVPVVLLAGLIALPLVRSPQQLPLDIERVSERVLVMSPKTGNSRVVVFASQQGLVMLDTGWSPNQARRLRTEAERAFHRSDWRAVVVTSTEFLANGGTGAFPETLEIAQESFQDYLDAQRNDMGDILADRRGEFQDRVERTRSMLDTLTGDPERRQGLEIWLGLCATIAADLEPGFAIPDPDLTFRDRLTLDLGDLTVECIFFGHAGEPGHVMVRVPEENLIWLGDVFHAAHVLPYGSYPDRPPDVDRWLAVLDDLLTGDRTTMKVYRANGDDRWTWQQLSDRRQLIADIRDSVREARKAGDSLDTVLARLTDVETAFPYVRSWTETTIPLISDDVRRTVTGLWLER